MIPANMIGDMMTAWSNHVSASRNRQGLAPLTNEGGMIGLGQEALAEELDSPRIVIVPVSLTQIKSEQAGGYGHAGNGAPTFTLADNSPKVLWTAHLGFVAHLWGDEWPGNAPKPMFWDFNTTLELHRELCVAIYRSVSGALGRAVTIGDLDFDQPTNMVRRGRYATMPFAVVIPILDEPYVSIPYGAHPKVETEVTIEGPTEDVGTFTVPS